MIRFYLFFLSLVLLAGTPAIAEETPETEAASASAAIPAAPPRPRTEPNIDASIASNLLKAAPVGTEVVELDTGKEDEKLIGYYKVKGNSVQQGGVIIFPDQHTHLDWPGDVSSLREGLTDYGWHTLAIYLPQSKKPALPERTLPVMQAISAAIPDSTPADNTEAEGSSEENVEEPPTPQDEAQPTEPVATSSPDEQPKEPTEPYNTQMIRLGQTAHNYLQQQGLERFIVIGLGTGAVWASEYVKQFQDSQNLRLIIIDPREAEVEAAPKLLPLLTEIKVPLVDLYHDDRLSDSSYTPLSAEQRLRTVRHKQMNNYHQSRLPAMRDDWKKESPWLLKHVRGIINTLFVTTEQMKRAAQMNSGQSEEGAPGMMRK